nr:ChaN family lipoprotein [Thermosulfurimonas marina]
MGLKPSGLAFAIPEKTPAEGLYLRVIKNPARPRRVLVWLKTSRKEEVQTLAAKLEHYWRSDRLFVRDGRVVEAHLSEGRKGLHLDLQAEVTGLPVRDLLPFEEILRRVALYRVILVGEEHDRYEHHLTQLRLIQALVEQGHRVALGLEMFQRPFQKALDDFLAGRIDERTLLRRTEYFKRWRFDWKLYRPLLLYARKEGLPVVALNAPSELVKKVSRKGLSALSVEEKGGLPQMDLDQEAYRAFLWKIYQDHRESFRDFPRFENFYQAQVLWDETMAETAWRWLKERPDYQMVILCGKGHVAFGYGIPSRLRRRGLSSVVSLVLASRDRLRPGYADFVLYPEPVSPPFSARLGVWLEETAQGLKVVRVEKGTVAEKYGLKAGDYLLAADGEKLSTVSDLRLILTFKEQGDELTLLLRRGPQQKEIKVKF